MVLRGLYDFEHVGTQHENNSEQNKREARLGCAHAHKLFEDIKVELTEDAKAKGFPESFADYRVTCDWSENNVPNGIRLYTNNSGQAVRWLRMDGSRSSLGGIMLIQTLTPTERTVTVEIPEEFLHQSLEIVLIPKEIAVDIDSRRKQIRAFFSQFDADASQLKYSRDELYNR